LAVADIGKFPLLKNFVRLILLFLIVDFGSMPQEWRVIK
jgi:hypothetical protein